MTEEERRLEEARTRAAHWRRWGPYLSDRQWGTVREDYSEHGTAWEYFPHDHARSRAYRWGEDGLFGISDNHQRLCFALALWNGQDPFLKERLFGLTGHQGNHGEDVKEYYFYLDNTPTHSYMKALYKYPQAAFPYQQLLEENRRRGRSAPECELLDTNVFGGGRYFDVLVEYAKASPNDLLMQISTTNQGPDPAVFYLLPTLWFRNTWSWDRSARKPSLRKGHAPHSAGLIIADHPSLGAMWLVAECPSEMLFTENESNARRLWNVPNASPYVKDGINQYLVQGQQGAVNPAQVGTKAAIVYQRTLAAGETWVVKLRLSDQFPPSPLDPSTLQLGSGQASLGTGSARGGPLSSSPGVGRGEGDDPLGGTFNQVFQDRKREADEFYHRLVPTTLNADARNVQRQAFAGMLWSKQFYHYVIKDWLEGDPACPPPPARRRHGRNHEWEHLYNNDILSMPDKWEYPWFAAWDLAFHCIPLAMVDPEFAKRQLLLLTREWYMHPNGQLPAYEWAFGDVNPPVHAWAAWRVYKIEKKMYGRADKLFLERVFQKLLLNFTWWVNRKDAEGRNIFQGGFLGLDNIGVFDRSKPLPTGGHIEQSDATSWMGMYCLNLLAIALELAQENPAYEDIASKFFEHFLYIAAAMSHMGGEETSLWDNQDGFFYDHLHLPNGTHLPMKIRSMVGLIPLFAIETLEVSTLFKLPGFARRFAWFMKHRPDLTKEVTCNGQAGACERRLLSIVTPDQLRRILQRMLNEEEFLSPYGIRAVSRYHKDHPYVFQVNGTEHRVDYQPAESSTGLFGGNSNWRGPVWMPVNFLVIEALQKFHHYLGDEFTVECPAGSGQQMTLWEVAMELSHRLMRVFFRDDTGRRPVYGATEIFQRDPHWRNLVLFYEYFHGDNGTGIGASHQTGWTGLIAKLIQQCGERCAHHHQPAVDLGVRPKAAGWGLTLS